MAATRVATATMRAAQIAKPGGEFEVVEREIPKPNAGEVLITLVASAVAMCLRKRASGREFSIRAFLGTKLSV